MLQAAKDSDLSPRELSFTSAMQAMVASWAVIPTQDGPTIEAIISAQIASLRSQLVGQRPNRVEPTAVKRRPKPIPLLTMPRDEARDLLLRGIDPYKKMK